MKGIGRSVDWLHDTIWEGKEKQEEDGVGKG
jgi:hypothetical protein